MLKQRMIKIVVGLALPAAVTGSAGLGVDSFGLAATSPAHACSSAGSSGGGC